jgi:hypothetical protein
MGLPVHNQQSRQTTSASKCMNTFVPVYVRTLLYPGNLLAEVTSTQLPTNSTVFSANVPLFLFRFFVEVELLHQLISKQTRCWFFEFGFK